MGEMASRVPGSLSGFDGKRHLPGVYNESARHAGVGARVQTRLKTYIHRIVPSWGVRLERVLSCGAQFRFGCDGN